MKQVTKIVLLGGLVILGALSGLHKTRAHASTPQPLHSPTPTLATPRPPADYSGRKRFGKASFYANFFAGRQMANGAPMSPYGSNAASRTLPLGTTAKVTNLETGQSAIIIIEDRGPYVNGRIVDLSPATARKIGISRRKGVSQVVVAPITVPQPDGSVAAGEALSEIGRNVRLAQR